MVRRECAGAGDDIMKASMTVAGGLMVAELLYTLPVHFQPDCSLFYTLSKVGTKTNRLCSFSEANISFNVQERQCLCQCLKGTESQDFDPF